MDSQRTSAEIARDRLLWCQYHDPATRASQKRQMAEFREAGLFPAMTDGVKVIPGVGVIPCRYPVVRRGKRVLRGVYGP